MRMIKKHPEWSEKYPALDGITNGKGVYFQKPIRSDIEEILKLNDKEFNNWFSERKITAQKLLKNYELIGSIPDLKSSLENFKNNLITNGNIGYFIGTLKEGIEYLEVIKQVREEYKK